MSEALDWMPKNLKGVVGLFLFTACVIGGALSLQAWVDGRAAAQVAPVAKDLAEHKTTEAAAMAAQKSDTAEAFKALNVKMDAVVNDVGAIRTDVAVLRAAKAVKP